MLYSAEEKYLPPSCCLSLCVSFVIDGCPVRGVSHHMTAGICSSPPVTLTWIIRWMDKFTDKGQHIFLPSWCWTILLYCFSPPGVLSHWMTCRRTHIFSLTGHYRDRTNDPKCAIGDVIFFGSRSYKARKLTAWEGCSRLQILRATDPLKGFLPENRV